MAVKKFTLADGRLLGLTVFEIESFPGVLSGGQDEASYSEKQIAVFGQLLNELHKVSGYNTSFELLWMTEKVEGQAFTSRVRIFCVLRKIDQDWNRIQVTLNTIKSNAVNALSSLQFGLDEGELLYQNMSELLEKIDDSCVHAIVKGEKISSSAISYYPYYFMEVVPNDNLLNFESLVSTLSQSEQCCVSFQLFPVELTSDELYMINEVSAELARIADGTIVGGRPYRDLSATEPLKVYSYYRDRRSSPFFMYNILAFGKRADSITIATKLVSHLQSGTDSVVRADFKSIDLSNEQIRLNQDFPFYVWNVNNKLLFQYRNMKIQQAIPLAQRLFRLPYLMSTEEAIVFFRPPLHDKSLIALKNNPLKSAQEQFVNSVIQKDNIQFGTLAAHDSSHIVIGSPEKAFTKHALIVGTPGSGKTTFSVNLLLQFFKKGIPFLAIEPTKTEYRAMIDAVPNLQIFTPGNNSVSPFVINPFVPPRGIAVEQFIPSLASAFKAAFSMPSPLDILFLKAIRACYTQYGWKDYSKAGDLDVTPFGLYEFIQVFKQELDHMNYTGEVKANLESAGLLRLTNLIEQNSNIYDTINTVPIEDLLSAPTVFELNAIDNAEQKSLIMALLLINICLYTKHNHVGDGDLKNVILIDEAHVLLGGSKASSEGQPDAQEMTTKALQDMIAEIRSYGTSIIIADQSPSKVSREIIANTDIKVSFRLVQDAEKTLIADSTNMDADSQAHLSRLKPGEAFVYYSLLEGPHLIRTPDIRDEERIRLSVSNEEIVTRKSYWDDHRELLIPFSDCKYCPLCKESCDFIVRSDADYFARRALAKLRSSIKSQGDFRKSVYYLSEIFKKEFEEYKKDREKLIYCTKIRFIRNASLALQYRLSDRDKEALITKFPKPKVAKNN